MNISEDLLDSVFNYRVKTNEEKNFVKLDLSMVQYNNLYHNFDYYNRKFPPGYDNIPGFPDVIQSIVEKNNDNTPLKEYNKRLS